MKQKIKASVILMSIGLLALVLIMFFNVFIFTSNAKLINIVIYAIIGTLMVSLVLAFAFRKEVLFKLSIVLSFLFVILYIVYYLLNTFGVIDEINSFNDIKDLILKYKGWGLFTYVVLNFLQVILVPIPSTLTILVGSAIFGPLFAFLFASIGILLGSIVAFYIGRIFSRPLINWIFGAEKVDKYEKILNHHTKLILFLVLFLPFFPDDMICMLAGITALKFKDFLWISVIARSTGIATISFFGSGSIIPFNTWWGISMWCIILTFILTISIVVYKKRKKIAHIFVKNK